MEKLFTQDLLSRLAKRAGELADMPLETLRGIAGTEDTVGGRHRELKGMSRGDLIEKAIDDEFEVECEDYSNRAG